MEGLKNNLKEQDKRIEDLKEKVNILEAQVGRASVLYFSTNVSVGVFRISVSLCVNVSCVCVSAYVQWCASVTLCPSMCVCECVCLCDCV